MINTIEELLEICKVKTEEELNWIRVSMNTPLSEEFIMKYEDKLDWFWICLCQFLSEEFIEKYLNKVNWFCIPRFQTLSKEFLLKHWEKIPILSVVKKCGNKKRVTYMTYW